MFAPTICSSVLRPFGLAHDFVAARQHGMDHGFVSAFDHAQRDPIADGGKVGAALGLVPQPSGDFGQISPCAV